MPSRTRKNVGPDPEAMDVDESSSLSELSEHDDAPAANPSATPENDASAENGAHAGLRRRSTRVVKQPSWFSEPLTSTRKTKRKRAAAGSDDESVEDRRDKDSSSSPGTIRGDDEAEEEDEEEEGDDDEEDSEEGESEDSEDEPDEEELKERRRKNKRAGRGTSGRAGRGGKVIGAGKKPAAKRMKTASGDAASGPPRQRATAKSRKGKGRAANGDVEGPPPMVNDLYEAIFESEDSYDQVTSGWVNKYKEDSSEAMKELINFILKSCGCNNEVTSYDIEDQDSASVTLSQIQDVFQKQQTAEYPLTSKKPAFRKFRSNLSAFVEALISTAISEKMLDTDLLENLQTWITAMSSSTLRQFRHTATVFALEMVTHLSEKAAEIRRTNGQTNRQLEAEQNKAAPNGARVGSLTAKLHQGEEDGEALEKLIKDIFETIFVHRYRDVDPKIRTDCVHELGEWVHILPEVFFDGTFIRYMGWVLSDTIPTTRLEVVKGLAKLFKKKENVSGLRHFTERFRPRLVEMATRDADTQVRAATIELLDVVREVGYLEPTDIETVGRLLFDTEQKVRKAVVGFFVENLQDSYQEKLEELGGEEAVQEALGDEDEEDYEGPTLSWIKLKCLVEALATYDSAEAEEDSQEQTTTLHDMVMKVDEIVSRFSLAGAVLWDAFEEVRDWEGVARYLLYDHSASRAEREDSGEDDENVEEEVKKIAALDSKEDVILLHVLHASVAGTIIKGPDPPTKKKAQPRTAKEIEKHKENVYRSLMKFIPLLLKKFGPVPDAASSVLRLGQLMNLDVFRELRQSTAYSSLLDDIIRQFLTHSDEGVLKEASKTLRHAKTFEDLQEVTDTKLGQLKDETITALANSVRGKDLATASFSEAGLTELINTVRRLEYISGIVDCVEMFELPAAAASAHDKAEIEPINVLLDLLHRGSNVEELEDELTLRTLKTLAYYFMWRIRGINSALQELDDTDIDNIIDRWSQATDRIINILAERGEVDDVKLAAGSTLLDLTTLFITATEIPRLGSLAQPLGEHVQDQLMSVLDGVEKAYAKSCGKKVEPADDAEPEDVDSDEEDEEEADQSTQLRLEQRLCEFAGKIVVAALARIVDPKKWRKRLVRNHAKLGPNFREVVNYLDRASVGRPGTRRGPQKKPPAAVPPPKSAETVEDEDEEVEQHDQEDEEEEDGVPEEEEEHHGERDENEGDNGSDPESEPDPEVEVPPAVEDEDEEMQDA